MTREEKQKAIDAVERLNALKQFIGYDKDSEIVQATQKSLDMAIKALEQEPCENAISRQAVLDATVKRNSIWNKITNSKGENLEEIISQLPPVKLHEPKTGHWIKHEHNGIAHIECSKCSTWYLWSHLLRKSYCPNCGTKMESEE